MTVIAYRDGIVAADSRESYGDGSVATCEKIFHKRIGRRDHVICTAGGSFSGMVFVDWYGSGKEPPESLTQLAVADEDFEVLVWDGKKLHTANHLCHLVPVIDPFGAIGCGRKAALGAMHVGATAKRAVEATCKVDPACAPPILVARLK